MPVEIITPKDRAAWLRARGKDVTASVVGCLFDAHEYVTVFELWAMKTGRLPRQDEETDAMRRGRLLEPVAVQIIREDHPEWQVEYSTDAQIYYRDPARRLGATPDVIVNCPTRGKGIIQIKSVEQGVYRRKWIDEDGMPDPPLWIALQAMLEAHLTGAQWAAIMPLVIGFGIDAPTIEVPLDGMPDIIEAMSERTAEFWAMVHEDREPQVDYWRDAALIDRLHAVGNPNHEVDLTADDEVLGQVTRILQQRQVVRDAEAAIATDEARIKAKLGTAEVAHLASGKTITWKTHRKRDPKTGIAKVYRRLRLPRI